MISITKIFRFEAAHAIHHYQGSCKNIHGHSYELHVTVKAKEPTGGYVEGLGIILDFKELKTLVKSHVVTELDHKLILSKAYLAEHKGEFLSDGLKGGWKPNFALTCKILPGSPLKSISLVFL